MKLSKSHSLHRDDLHNEEVENIHVNVRILESFL
jgi:hypothetical protein